MQAETTLTRYEVYRMAVPIKHSHGKTKHLRANFNKNEKATRQLGWPSLSRENSSNGDQAVKTFWRNLKSRKRGVSSYISEINVFIFNELANG